MLLTLLTLLTLLSNLTPLITGGWSGGHDGQVERRVLNILQHRLTRTLRHNRTRRGFIENKRRRSERAGRWAQHRCNRLPCCTSLSCWRLSICRVFSHLLIVNKLLSLSLSLSHAGDSASAGSAGQQHAGPLPLSPAACREREREADRERGRAGKGKRDGEWGGQTGKGGGTCREGGGNMRGEMERGGCRILRILIGLPGGLV